MIIGTYSLSFGQALRSGTLPYYLNPGSINQFISTKHNNTTFDIKILHSLHKLACASTLRSRCILTPLKLHGV